MCVGAFNFNATQSKINRKDLQEKWAVELMKKEHNLQEELGIELEIKSHELQEMLVTEPLTSSTTRLVPFYQPLINSLKPWFSVQAWSTWGDKASDSVVNAILSYSKRVAEDCPNLFPNRLDSKKSLLQEFNKGFNNDLISHTQIPDQSPLLQIERFNYMQQLNHTSFSSMLPSGSQFMPLSK